MANKVDRPYPRFLFCNPSNIKSEGPFLIHTIEPKFIARISLKPDTSGLQVFSNKPFFMTILDTFIDNKDRSVIERAFAWFESKIESAVLETGSFVPIPYVQYKVDGVKVDLFKK